MSLEQGLEHVREFGAQLVAFIMAFHAQPLYGALIAVGSLAFVLIILAIQNKNAPEYVRQYRHYEVALILRRKLSVHRLVEYHRGIVWRDFAAISTGSGLAGAALMFGGSDIGESAIAGASGTSGLTLEASIIVMSSIAVQVGSAIMMMICDFVHTNTISPLVPPLQRMRIVGDTLVLGGGAMIFNIAALISFMSVFSPWVSVLCSAVFAVSLIRLTALRAIRVKELMRWLKIKHSDEWEQIDREVRLMKKAERDRRFEDEYYASWSDECEDPAHKA